MTKIIRAVSNRYRRWVALLALSMLMLMVPFAFAIDVSLDVTAITLCNPGASHQINISWDVTDAAAVASVQILIQFPDTTFQIINTNQGSGNSSLQIDFPVGGTLDVQITATGVDVGGGPTVNVSDSDRVNLESCTAENCSQSAEETVSALLPSIREFELISTGQFDFETEFPVPASFPGSGGNGQGVNVLPIATHVEVLGPVGSGDQGNAYAGTANGFMSKVALYATNNQVSGFLALDDASISEWIFIEPLKPLLLGMLHSEELLRSYDPNNTCSRDDYVRLINNPRIFPSGNRTHIAYNTKDTDFAMRLTQASSATHIDDHVGTDKRFQQNAHRSLSAQTDTQNHLAVVPFGDAAFRLQYLNGEETWLDGQLKVLNLVRSFYQEVNLTLDIHQPREFDDSSPVPVEALPFTENPLLALMPDQNGDGIPDLNAFTYLCHFAQGFPNEPTVPPTVSNITSPYIVHLFTGQDLGPVYLDEGSPLLNDSGCCLCEVNCGMKGPDVIGLAEGVGGVWQLSSTGCRSSDGVLSPAANHALSQHTPKFRLGSEANDQYQATLYQRFLIVAHEIGHNASLPHSGASDSVMSAMLVNEPDGDNIEFKLAQTGHTGVSQEQIANCLNPSIEPCIED